MNPFMKYSENGLLFTEGEEGFKLTPYQDSAGVWTDGYGNTKNVVPNGPPISLEQARADLIDNIACAEYAVNHYVTVELTQREFDALVDFTFNAGVGAFAGSTMLKLLNAGKLVDAANEFEKWDHAGGKVVAGLLARRTAEADLFDLDAQQT